MDKWLELFKNNDYLNVKKYIKEGFDVNACDEGGESVLACGIKAGCELDLLFLLIENGADIFHFDAEGVSIFDMAIAYGNIEMVHYLINHGIDVNKTQRRSGFTSLMAAACYGRIEITQVLIANGANQQAVDAKGFTAADFARKMNKKSILNLLQYDENAPINNGYAR